MNHCPPALSPSSSSSTLGAALDCRRCFASSSSFLLPVAHLPLSAAPVNFLRRETRWEASSRRRRVTTTTTHLVWTVYAEPPEQEQELEQGQEQSKKSWSKRKNRSTSKSKRKSRSTSKSKSKRKTKSRSKTRNTSKSNCTRIAVTTPWRKRATSATLRQRLAKLLHPSLSSNLHHPPRLYQCRTHWTACILRSGPGKSPFTTLPIMSTCVSLGDLSCEASRDCASCSSGKQTTDPCPLSIKITTVSPQHQSFEGVLFTADPITNLVAINTTPAPPNPSTSLSSQPGNYHIIPIKHILSFQILSLADQGAAPDAATGDSVTSSVWKAGNNATPKIGPVDIKKLKEREEKAVQKQKDDLRKRGKGVSAEAQAIFDALDRLYASFDPWTGKNETR